VTKMSTSTSKSTAFPCAARSGVCITGKGILIAVGYGKGATRVSALEQVVVPNRRALCERLR